MVRLISWLDKLQFLCLLVTWLIHRVLSLNFVISPNLLRVVGHITERLITLFLLFQGFVQYS